jgi:hypothetical protein
VTGTAAGLTAPPSRPRSHAHLQALDDAICYRAARLKAICRKCRPARPCDVHACDLRLLEAYHRMARDAIAALQAAGRRRGHMTA